MHPLFKPYKKLIPPPIFSIIMSIVFIGIGVHTIVQGWFNTGRGKFVRIITYADNPTEFIIRAVGVPFGFALLMIALAYVGYSKNVSDEDTKKGKQ
jgi:hypothetical protein